MKINPINWELALHPMNWLTIILMLVIAGAIGHCVLSLAGIEPSKKRKSVYAGVPAGQVPAGDAISAINPASAGLVS